MAKQESRLYLLHGWAVDEKNEDKWQIFRQELKSLGIKSEFIGLPGLSFPLNEVWQLDDYVDFIRDKISDHGTIILGHSFGGQIAVRLSAEYPELVDALILVDSSGLRPNDLLSTLKRGSFKLLAKIGGALTSSEQLRALLYRVAGEKDYYEANPTLRETMKNVISTDVSSDLAKITQPVQLVWGEKDRVTPLSLARRFAQLLPKADLKIISGARHSPQFTHPQETAKIVASFLEKIR